MQKKGLSHIEVIISFILFIGFLMFGLYFFNPLNGERVLDSSLTYAVDEILSNATTDLLVYSVVIEGVSAGQISFPLARVVGGSGVRVESSEGEQLPSSYMGNGTLAVERAARNFFLVKFGEFNSNDSVLAGAVPLTVGKNVSISSSEKRRVLSEKRLIILHDLYASDYEALRTSFNLPRRVDFSFSLTLPNGEAITGERKTSDGVDAFSKTQRIEMVRLDGSTVFGDLNVRVW